MKSNVFQNALAKTSAVFGRKDDIKVVFAGNEAKTNGSIIQLPALSQGAEISDDDAAVLRGYVDHEAGHVRHTNFNVLKRNKKKLTGNKLLHSTANALEDIWLERRVMGEYHGARTNLRATSERVNKLFIDSTQAVSPEEAAQKLADPVWVGPVAITWQGRAEYGGELNTACLDMLEDDELRGKLEEWIGKLDGCKDSYDVFRLAEEAEQWLRNHKEEQEQEQEGDDGRGTYTPDGEADGDVDDGQRQHSDDEGDGTDVAEGSPDEESDGDGDTDVGETETPTGEGDMDDVYDDFGLEKAVESLAPELNYQRGKDAVRYIVVNSSWDKWHHRSDPQASKEEQRENAASRIVPRLANGTAAEYDHVLAAMGGTANAVRRKLERALLAKQKRDWDFGREDGRLDVRRLPAVMSGRTNVFKTRTDRTDLDTAVSLLIDLSGSMYGSKAQLAMRATICLAEAIDRTGIAYEILGFQNLSSPTYPKVKSRYHAAKKAMQEYSKMGAHRWEPLDMTVFKSFDERLQVCKGAIAQIEHSANGNNSDGDAINNANIRLQARDERRKILIVLSDGSPAHRGDYRAEGLYTRQVVKSIEASDTSIVGIGILDGSVREFYRDHVVINDVNDLTGTVMDQLAKMLLGERFVVDNSQLLDRAV